MKNPAIDVLKGIAIILVVCGHVVQRTMVPSGADFFLNPAFKFIYTFHMPLFVFLSGYLMAFSVSRRSLGDTLKTRCKSLLVPFASWGILGILTNYALNIVDGRQADIARLPWDVADQLFFNPSVWFLFTLFVLSAALLLSIRLEKHMGVGAFVLVYLLMLSIPYNDYFSLYYIKWFYVFYAAGYWANRCHVAIPSKPLNPGLLVAALIAFALLVSFWNKSDYIYLNKMSFMPKEYPYEFLRYIYRYGIGFLGIIIAFYVATYAVGNNIGTWLARVGVYSLDIYLIQRYIVEGLYPRLVVYAHINFDFNSPLFMVVFVPVMALLFVGLCMVISKLLIRNNPLWNKLLLGNRS